MTVAERRSFEGGKAANKILARQINGRGEVFVPSPNLSAPFRDVTSFTLEPNTQSDAPRIAAPARCRSCRSMKVPTVPTVLGRATHKSGTFAAEWHDNELDRHVYEAIAEASEVYDQSGGDTQALRQHFAPLMREVEQAFDSASERFARSELSQTEQSELEAFFDSYAPRQEMSPAFENLFGSIFRAIKKSEAPRSTRPKAASRRSPMPRSAHCSAG